MFDSTPHCQLGSCDRDGAVFCNDCNKRYCRDCSKLLHKHLANHVVCCVKRDVEPRQHWEEYSQQLFNHASVYLGGDPVDAHVDGDDAIVDEETAEACTVAEFGSATVCNDRDWAASDDDDTVGLAQRAKKPAAVFFRPAAIAACSTVIVGAEKFLLLGPPSDRFSGVHALDMLSSNSVVANTGGTLALLSCAVAGPA